MGQRYLIDTNTVIEYLNGTLPDIAANLIEQERPCVSVITRIELLVWRNATEEHLHKIREFINASIVLNLEERVILKTIEIRKLHRIKLPDVIIAATALTNNLQLITRNSADFRNVAELQVINPFLL
jgi:predicted nucleic acid-binding protein